MLCLTNNMAYIRIKIIKNHAYRYLVKGIRTKDKVQQKVIKYLGAVERVRKKKNVGRKPSIFIRKLTEEEFIDLNKTTHSTESFKKDRAKIILLSSERKSVKEICKSLSKDRKAVVRAINEFNKNGINSLIRKMAKGSKPKFTVEQRAIILQTVLTEPTILGMHFTTWSLPKLKKYLIEKRVVKSICIESIRKILSFNNSNYIKCKRRQYSNDSEFLKKTN